MSGLSGLCSQPPAGRVYAMKTSYPCFSEQAVCLQDWFRAKYAPYCVTRDQLAGIPEVRPGLDHMIWALLGNL